MGPTTLAAHLIQKLAQQGVSRFVVFGGNESIREEWACIVHPLYVHGQDIDTFIRIKDHQAKIVSNDRDAFEAEEHRRKTADPTYEARKYEIPSHMRLGVIFHTNDTGFMHAQAIKDACSNGRHYGLDMLLLQNIMLLPVEIREQMDYVFLLRSSHVDTIFQQYIPRTCYDIGQFRDLWAACTDQRGQCMLIDNTTTSATQLFSVKFPA